LSDSIALFAARIALVTTVRHEDLVTFRGHFPIPARTRRSTTQEVEELCGIPPSRYFYAGLACCQFGDCAFALFPSVEAEHDGCVNPFDTGGVYKGYPHPFRSIADRDEMRSRARRLIKETRYGLRAWRTKFADFLRVFFPKPADYLKRQPPGSRHAWGPDDLPARHPENTADWRAWSWEIRVYEAHPADRHLMSWSCTDEVYTKLINERTVEDDPVLGSVNPLDKLLMAQPPIRAADFCASLEARVQSEVFS